MSFLSAARKKPIGDRLAKEDVLELARLFEDLQHAKDPAATKNFLEVARKVLPSLFTEYLLMRDRLCPYCLAGYPVVDGYHDLSGFVQETEVPILSRWKEEKRQCVVESLYARHP